MTTREPTTAFAPNHYVTEHYLYSDFICPCCDRLKIIPAFFKHVRLLEEMREMVGFPVVVTSGYRCREHNAKVGGAPKSWHMLFATDVAPGEEDEAKLKKIYEAALELGFGGVGMYETHVHLDLRPRRVVWRG